MKDAFKLNVFFNGDKTLFLIPLYQRNYAWQRKHCERLFADLEKIHDKNIRTHFFGSIVSVKANEWDEDLLIIDGQQRITTVSLLILAAINAVRKGKMKCENGDEYLTDMTNKFLRAKYRSGDRKIKLRPIDRDLKAYDALFSGDESEFVPAEESGITRNYNLFYQLIGLSHLTFEDLIDAIDRLIVIDIRLDSSDNPQLIFESLNSCGKDLEEADKVRNYLLMSLTNEEQEEYYRKYWSKIEVYTDNEPTMFIRDYLTVKQKTISNITELYFDFKSYDEKSGKSRCELLEDMLRFATFYMQAYKGKTSSERLNRKFRQIANTGSTVTLPFFMSFLDYADTKSFSEDEIYNTLQVIEGYWARRIICGLPANVLSKVFAMLHWDVMRIIAAHEKREVALEVPYSELVKYVLLHKQRNARFPEDSEINKRFPERTIYTMPIDYRYFLFERLENENSKEANDTIVQMMKEGKASIEHIMPQRLTPEWKNALGEKWEEIHETYLHTMANLTLTGYNSNYSNHPFSEKKNGYTDRKGNKIDGFSDSAFRLSNYLKQIDQWTLTEILERQKILLGKFKALWPMIESAYVPLVKESETVSFEDEKYELTGRTIFAFNYKETRYEVGTWKQMLLEVCKLIYTEQPTAIAYLAAKDYWLHPSPNKKYSFVAENVYVYSSSSVRTIQSTLRYIFEQLSLPMSDLEYELKPINDKVLEEDETEDEES